MSRHLTSVTAAPALGVIEAAQAPPYDASIEGSVLHSLLLWPATRAEVLEALLARDFYVPLFGRIFETISDMLTAGEDVDYQLVARELERRAVMSAVEAAQLFCSLDGVLYHGPSLAREVARLARCRRILDAATTAAAAARRGDEDGALEALRGVA